MAHACAQCRSNKGAPGVDGQDFPEVEKYGVQRWLGELARRRGRLISHERPQSVATRRNP